MLPEADDPVGNCNLIQDELITYALICTMANANAYMATYLTDCQHIWDNIAVIMHELDCWTYVRLTQHTIDGHLAYQNVNGHYLGVNNVNNMSTLVEAKLESMIYDREKDDWNFKKYVKIHVDQDVILAGFAEHGYSSIVEKPQFSIGLISSCPDQFNSCALLKSKIPCLHVSFTTYEYFYKLSKSASFS